MAEFLEAGKCPILSYDDMVKYLDVEQYARLFERLGDLNVLERMCNIATRMVVGDDYCGDIGGSRGPEDLTV